MNNNGICKTMIQVLVMSNSCFYLMLFILLSTGSYLIAKTGIVL